ncbi:hypothetical protein C3B58_18905 [Lactonifactor longoviformis]|uniref:Glucan-binding domain-containing protein (YG repeat) n=2 Tax=Lactonifactor TaxID=420345 RepID=A0A1M5APQ8_9CLOT|nr:MBL fold metallo-hydrolase [Lactonifactor longoviformis]POP30903.1 hypothetical protein C3B58_18905 [Lactonifactor longoviformis]SHF32154.1 Glucan-binding domain-containing protein (YG repeat) [Lactonifactor longoviformis DSM 17459]
MKVRVLGNKVISRKSRMISFILGLVVILTGYSQEIRAEETSDIDNSKIHFIAIPAWNDAILLESNGRFGMIDSGEDTAYPDGSDPRYPIRSGTIMYNQGYEEQVIEYLRSVGVNENNFEFYLGTHPHSDHIGSASYIIKEFKPERVYMMEYKDEYISSPSNLWDNLYVYDRLIEAAKEAGSVLIQNFDKNAPITPAQEAESSTIGDEGQNLQNEVSYQYMSPEEIHEEFGVDPLADSDPQAPDTIEDRGVPVSKSADPNQTTLEKDPKTTGNPNFTLGDMQLEVVNYSDDYKITPKPDANYFSLGVKVSVNAHTAFLGGDIGNYDGDELKLIPYIGEVDILKLGHHGYSSSNTPEYLYALNPDYLVQTGYYSTLTVSAERMESIRHLAENNGTRLYSVANMVSSYDAVIFDLSGQEITTNVSEDEVYFWECNGSPYYTCYRDGYQFPYQGFVSLNGNEYYFDNSPNAVISAWVRDSESGFWYLMDDKGHKRTGWIIEKNNKYYLDKDGIMQTGWTLIDNNWYYFNASGQMQTGWVAGNYFDTDGTWVPNPVQEKWIEEPGGWKYQLVNGKYVTNGWKKINNKTYYFNESGYMASGWKYIDNSWYYFGAYHDGAMKIGWIDVNGIWYYMNNDGKMATGWKKLFNKWYYLRANGSMSTKWEFIKGNWYYFQEDGSMITGWFQENNIWYYLRSNGDMATGWERINGEWYFLRNSGAMATGWIYDKDRWYYLKNSGAMTVGWMQSGGGWYYMWNSGAMATGWSSINGEWYFFQDSGLMKTGWLNKNGQWYYLKNYGAMAIGWLQIDRDWYYFRRQGDMATGWVGDYYLDSSGKWIPGKRR